ncbi:polysaccharide deacetylase family protein [uncultured Sunxiuqinia sp.]|uniref:polysaccharide deacetylase family protein n=1 Tax=uncultured Sunxiuqinia sp. TaxID=1573825 RepID=UPI002AA6749A|nr:polysaccharide deacetylase family protein [uncultured Sunxiuqinia sp.]
MNRKIRLLLVLILLTSQVIDAQIMWPESKKAAIVLSYDDGLNSHLNYAIPQLNAYGFKGTFFLYGYLPEDKFDEWEQVSEQGHEIGNHSLFHPCKGDGKEGRSPRFYSEDYDVPSMLREIGIMNKLIFAITGKKPESYAYPCGETVVGGVDYSDSLKQAGLLKYARNGKDTDGITSCENLNPYKVPAYGVKRGSSADDLIQYVKTVMKNEGLGIFIFHGVGGDYLDIDANVHQELLDYLNDHQDELWITTFSEVMEEITNKD